MQRMDRSTIGAVLKCCVFLREDIVDAIIGGLEQRMGGIGYVDHRQSASEEDGEKRINHVDDDHATTLETPRHSPRAEFEEKISIGEPDEREDPEQALHIFPVKEDAREPDDLQVWNFGFQGLSHMENRRGECIDVHRIVK